jgi:hypothetical protein
MGRDRKEKAQREKGRRRLEGGKGEQRVRVGEG